MPRVRLVEPAPPEPRTWEGPAATLFPGDERLAELKVPGAAWRVLGGPGTGKSSLLVDLAVAHVAAGWSADSVQVLAHSKEAAARLRDDVARRLPPGSGAGSGGMVRAVHSLAFALVRSAAVRDGRPEPALATGAREDAVIRELLAGHADEGGAYWPERLIPALRMRGLARQLRDLLLRAQERGLLADDLEELGRRHNIAEWVAAGTFLREYRQVMRLAWHEELNAAELVSTAVRLIDDDPGLVESAGIKVLLVDDAEHLDPQSAELIRRFIPWTDLTVVTGDHDQSVLAFRGADAAFLDTVADPAREIVLHTSRRCTPEVAVAANRVAARLPGDPPQRGIRGTRGTGGTRGSDGTRGTNDALGTRGTIGDDGRPGPAARVVVHDTGMGEKATVADFLRRAHLEHGVAWSDMAVLVRSGAGESALHRSLARAGVPVRMDPTDVVLGEQRMVAALVLALRAIVGELSASEWERLLTGPLGNADPIALTRLIRGVRRADLTGARAMDVIVDLLAAEPRTPGQEDLIAGLPQRERDVLEGPLKVLDAGRAARGEGVEAVAWALWEASGLADHFMATSLRGGAGGSAADRDLDGVMTFFDFVGDLVEGNPGITIGAVIREIEAHELPTGARDRRGADREAVAILSAHAALGREWSAVAVAGVQEDVWPSLGRTGSVVKQQELVDLLDDGITPGTPVSHAATRLAEERRLFHVAVSRARERLLITAVDAPDDEGEPSRFLAEVGVDVERKTIAADTGAGADARADARAAAADVAAETGAGDRGESADGAATTAAPATETREDVPRVLSMQSLLAELRAAVIDPDAGPVRRRQAARQLARLADAGVPGADPADWWGLTAPSTDEPVETTPVRVNPSKVNRVRECALRALLERTAPSSAMAMGSAFHRITEILGDVDIEDAEQALRDAIPELTDEPAWRLAPLIEEWARALHAWRSWEGTQNVVGMEVDVRVPLGDDIVLTGRIDRLAGHPRDPSKLTIVDIKTGKAVSKDDAEADAQLATYQLALALGRLIDGPDGPVIGPDPTRGSEGGNGGGDGGDGGGGNGAHAPDASILGGATLVYPRDPLSGGDPKTRLQAARTGEQLEEWVDVVTGVAAALRGPGAIATPGKHCEFCTVRLACPAKEGAR